MGFGEAISTNLSKITDFTGRASRPEFWWWILAVWIVEVVAGLLFGNLRGGNGFLLFIGWIIYIILWLATLAVGCRRLHHTRKSGWLQLLLLIPCIGVIILIIFWVQPGNSTGDKYGPAPAS